MICDALVTGYSFASGQLNHQITKQLGKKNLLPRFIKFVHITSITEERKTAFKRKALAMLFSITYDREINRGVWEALITSFARPKVPVKLTLTLMPHNTCLGMHSTIKL